MLGVYTYIYIYHIYGRYVFVTYLISDWVPFHQAPGRYEAASELTERLCNLVTEEAVFGVTPKWLTHP